MKENQALVGTWRQRGGTSSVVNFNEISRPEISGACNRKFISSRYFVELRVRLNTAPSFGLGRMRLADPSLGRSTCRVLWSVGFG